MFTPALAVRLACDGRVTAVLAANPAGGQHDVDRAHHVLNAVAVMLQPSGVHQEAGLGLSPPFRRLLNGLLGDASDFGGALEGPLIDLSRDRLEAHGVLLDELVIEPVVLDHEPQDPVEQGRVPTRLYGHVKIAGAGDGGDARIDDDDLRAMITGLPDV